MFFLYRKSFNKSVISYFLIFVDEWLFKKIYFLSGMKAFLVLTILALIQLCSGSKILFLIPMPSKSHFILGDELIRALSKRGHEVTVVSPFQFPNPPKGVSSVILPEMSHVFGRKLIFILFIFWLYL